MQLKNSFNSPCMNLEFATTESVRGKKLNPSSRTDVRNCTYRTTSIARSPPDHHRQQQQQRAAGSQQLISRAEQSSSSRQQQRLVYPVYTYHLLYIPTNKTTELPLIIISKYTSYLVPIYPVSVDRYYNTPITISNVMLYVVYS